MTISIVVLLCVPADADVVVAFLTARLRSVAQGGAAVERPPDALLGMNFMRGATEAQAWWESAAAAAASDWLMIAEDEPSLLDEIDGVASRWLVWCRDPSRAAEYADVPNAQCVAADDAWGFSDAVLRWLAQDAQLASLLRPTFGPFRRGVARDGYVQPRAPRIPAVDGDGHVIGSPPGAPDVGRNTGRPLVISVPPMEFLATSNGREMAATSADAVPVVPDEANAVAPAIVRERDRRISQAATRGYREEPGDGPPRAAIPPAPPLMAMGPAAVPQPPTPLAAVIPAPPPETAAPAPSDAARAGAVASAIPPAPPDPDLADELPSNEMADRDGVRSAGVVANAWAIPDERIGQPPPDSSSSSPPDEHLDLAARASTHVEPDDVEDLASTAAPLDALPVLEPSEDVAEAGERGPRQIGFWSVGSSLRRMRRRAEVRPPAQEPVSSRLPARPVRSVDGDPLSEMTEAQLRGDAAKRLMLGPPLVVVCCSRKGGVGKTYDILGIAELADEAGEAFAVRSVLLEQNLENPDLRVVLGLPEATGTVRQLDRALSDGMDAPGAAHPTQSNLSVYVEERETSAYPRESVERIAQHCRSRYGLTAVDLANCLPDVTGGKAATAVAHWLRHADVVMMPTDASLSGLRGMAEMIDAVRTMGRASGEGVPGIVIPFLVQPGGKALQYPGIQEILARYDGQGAKPVAVPFSEETQLAGWEDAEGQRTTILHDDTVRLAYWRLLVAVLRAGNARGGS